MTTTIAYGDAADGYLENFSSSYSTALAGSGTFGIVNDNDTKVRIGQNFTTPNYFVDESFISFAYTVPAGETVATAYIRLRNLSADGTATTRALVMSEYDWGASMTTADWRNTSQLNALTTMATIDAANNAGNLYMSAGSNNLNTRLASASPLRLVCTTDRVRAATTPSGAEQSYFISADSSGTGDDPALIFGTAVADRIRKVLGAQAQLSDGTHVYIENNQVTVPSISLKHRDAAGSVTTISSIPSYNAFDPTEYFSAFDAGFGAQQLTMTVDSSDNIYIVGPYGGNSSTGLAAQAYTKGVGYSWTQQTLRSASMASYTDGIFNNFSCAWHNVGTAGTIMVVAAHVWGRSQNATGDAVYALLNCNYLLTGSGSLLRNSGAARGVVISSNTDGNNHTNHVNPTGSLLDVVAAPSTTDRGYVASPFAFTTGLGDSAVPSVTRYILASDGTSVTDSDIATYTMQGYNQKDPAAKLRIIGISPTVFVSINADPTSGWGITAEVLQNTGTSGTFSVLGQIQLDGVNATMPTETAIAVSSLWDAVYDPTANKIWVYYMSAADNRRLMRTSINLNTYLATGDEVEVSAAVGAVGSTNYALRVHRGPLNGQTVLVCVSNVDSGLVKSTQYVADTFNVAPTAPTLTTKANFDATASAAFSWTFNDPNAGDTQSAFQMQVNTSGGVFEYDSAKVSASVATYIGAGAFATGNNASLVPALPGSIADGDTLLCYATIRNSGTGTVGTAPSGWQTLLSFGNIAILGKVYATGDTAPTVTFSGGVANADTTAQIAAFRNLPLNVVASATQLNGSAQNVAYPALTVPNNASVVIVAGWKQDDSTGYAQLAGMTEIGETNPTAGDDASAAWDYVIQTTASNISASSFTVSGGASAISRGITLSLGPAGNTATSSSITLVANTLTNAGSWQWRVRTYDAAGLVSPWSNYGTFSTAAGGNVTITSPASDNPGGQITDNYTIVWNATGTTQAYYRVKVVRTSDSSTLSDTGFVASVATSADISGLLSGVEYRVEVTVRNAGLVDSGTGTRLITPSYGAPDTPLQTLSAPTNLGYILVSIDNPTPTGDRPTPSSNQILRRLANSGDDYVAIGITTNDGTYKDYAVASGVTYEYVVRAVAD